MTTTDWILIAVQGLVVIGFIALGVKSGGIGLGLWGGVGTLVLVFVFGLDPGEPPIERDADHHRRHLGGGRDAGGRRRRLHGQDREHGAASASEGAQLHRAVRLLRAHDPDRHEQHVLLDHPGDQRGRLREQDPARAGACRLDRRLGVRDHVEPGRRRDGDDPAARRDLQLRPGRRAPDHDPGEHHRHLRDVARDEPPRQGTRRRPGVPAPAGGRARSSRPRPPAEIELLPFAKRSVAIFLARRARDLRLRLRRGASGRRSRPRAAASSRCR